MAVGLGLPARDVLLPDERTSLSGSSSSAASGLDIERDFICIV